MVQSQNQRGLHSKALDMLRFPLAVMVVLVHTFPHETGFDIVGKSFNLDNFPIFYEILAFIHSFIRGQSVPIYYFISGYVFFLGISLTKETYLRKLKNRTKTLLIPYFIWNALALAVLFAAHLPMFRQYLSAPDAGELFNPTIANILSSFWSSSALTSTGGCFPINVPLWFVRDLIIVVLCTPVLYWIIRKLKHWPIIILGVMWFCLAVCEVNDCGFMSAFFFFSWGAYMSISQKDMITEFGRFFKPSVILYPLLGVLGMLSIHFFPAATTTIKLFNILVGLLFAYNLAVWLLQKGYCKVNSFLASSSFFIYVSHAIICGKIRTFLYVLTKPAEDLGVIAVYVSALILTVFSLLASYWVLKRYTPSLLKILTGRK